MTTKFATTGKGERVEDSMQLWHAWRTRLLLIGWILKLACSVLEMMAKYSLVILLELGSKTWTWGSVHGAEFQLLLNTKNSSEEMVPCCPSMIYCWLVNNINIMGLIELNTRSEGVSSLKTECCSISWQNGQCAQRLHNCPVKQFKLYHRFS